MCHAAASARSSRTGAVEERQHRQARGCSPVPCSRSACEGVTPTRQPQAEPVPLCARDGLPAIIIAWLCSPPIIKLLSLPQEGGSSQPSPLPFPKSERSERAAGGRGCGAEADRPQAHRQGYARQPRTAKERQRKRSAAGAREAQNLRAVARAQRAPCSHPRVAWGSRRVACGPDVALEVLSFAWWEL